MKQFLLECADFRIIRSRFFRVNSLKELFDTVEPVKIFSFLKEIGIYNIILSSRGIFTIFDFICVYTARWTRSFFMLSDME